MLTADLPAAHGLARLVLRARSPAHKDTALHDYAAANGISRWRRLPPWIRPEDWTETEPTDATLTSGLPVITVQRAGTARPDPRDLDNEPG